MKQESPIKRRKSRQIMVGDVPVGGDAPIAVLAIAGLNQTGKSFLLNQLLGKDADRYRGRFAVGGDGASGTKGIWCCAVPVETWPARYGEETRGARLLLLDAEGFGREGWSATLLDAEARLHVCGA